MNGGMIRFILGSVLKVESVLLLFPCIVAVFYRESAGFALEHCGHCGDFGTHLHLQLLVREISCAETLPPGVQSAARAEEHDIHDVSGAALRQCAGGDGTDFLHCLPQHLERVADVPVRPPEISAPEAARCVPAGGTC